MLKFKAFAKKLLDPLSKEEEEFLLYEYAKTKSYEIRDKLIVHNLKRCAEFALNHCSKHNCIDSLDEIYSDCVLELIKAIDDNNVSEGKEFEGFLNKYFQTMVVNKYKVTMRDALGNVVNLDIHGKDDDEISESEINFFVDKYASNFRESIADEYLVRDIFKYINSLEERTCVIIKMYCGLGGYKKLKQSEIAKLLNVSETTVKRKIKIAREKIKYYLAKNYPLSFPNIIDEILRENEDDVIEFDDIQSRDEYIWNCYYGINCEKKTAEEIAKEVGLKLDTIRTIIRRRKIAESLNGNDTSNLEDKRNTKKSKWTEELKEKVFNSYFGINGYEVHDMSEIIKMLDFDTTENAISEILRLQKKLYIGNGTYTKEEIDDIAATRKLKRRQTKVLAKAKYAYEYNSYYGLNGCEKKSLLVLAKELMIPPSTVYGHVKHYEEYLQVKAEEMKDNGKTAKL